MHGRDPATTAMIIVTYSPPPTGFRLVNTDYFTSSQTPFSKFWIAFELLDCTAEKKSMTLNRLSWDVWRR
jgi:hypothetical protein